RVRGVRSVADPEGTPLRKRRPVATTDPILLSDLDSNLLPRTLAGPIFEKSVEQSAVMTLAQRAPLSIDSNTSIPIPLDVPTADWVGQGARKPLSSGGIDVKQMSPKKIAVRSEERRGGKGWR